MRGLRPAPSLQEPRAREGMVPRHFAERLHGERLPGQAPTTLAGAVLAIRKTPGGSKT